MLRPIGAILVLGTLAVVSVDGVRAQPGAVPAPATTLFAVEIRTGPAWDAAKPANEQAYFAEHSTNLRRLREAGSLIVGARYSDKGLLVLEATSEAEARAQMQRDPSIEHGVFTFELHELNVFYEGAIRRPSR